MRIESSIDYWDGGLLNYDPARIRAVFFEYFPEAIFDKTNHSRVNLERFFHNVKEKNLEPPDFIIDRYWELAFQSGPTFIFEIPNKDDKKIVTIIRRFNVSFETDFVFDNETEIKIIGFLRLLKYGVIKSNQQTENFSEIYKDQKDCWILKTLD